MKFKISVILFFSGIFFLFSCRQPQEKAVYTQTYRNDQSAVTVTADRLNLNPADRLTVTVLFRHDDGLIPRITWVTEPPLTLTETFETPDTCVFRFDSTIPGTYILPPLSVTFGEEKPIFTDEIRLQVYSESNEETLPTEIRPLQDDLTDRYMIFLTVSLIMVLILAGILVFLIIRYFHLRRQLRTTIIDRSLDILESIQTAAANHFDELEVDKVAVLILQTLMLRFHNKDSMALLLSSFSPDTVTRLRAGMEKYRRIAFARDTVGKTELLEDLNFFIGFQKQFENCRKGENHPQ